MLANHDQIRATFPGLADKVFLDAACVSLASQPTVTAIQAFLQDTLMCPEPSATAHHIAMDVAREQVRDQAARLINATPEEIAIVESTSYGLSAITAALPFEAGDNVVLCDLEYLQVAIPFYHVQKQVDIEIRQVQHQHGIVTAHDFAKVCNERTRAIVVSSVQWSHGLRLDLAGLSEVARQCDAWLIVDAVQHLGAASLDVAKLGVDIVACGGHKWLNSPYGCGFLYINKDRLETIEPLLRGYLTLQDPEGGWGTYFRTPSITPFRDYHYVQTAKQFEVGGTANYPGAIGLAASINQIMSIGPTAIEQHIQQLSDYLIEQLQQRDLQVVTPLEQELRAGIVTFRCFENPEQESQVAEWLSAERVYASTRFTSNIGGTRISIHFFNNQADLDRLLEQVDRFIVAHKSESLHS